MTTVIQVGDQAPADRLEYWRSVLCETFLPLDAVPAGDTDRPIEGTLRFTPDAIAAAHFISTRYLHKLFARHGETVAGWTRARRLERCRQDLRHPGLRHRPISAVGARWGLVDASHFSRAFRAAYGVTPSEYRHGSSPAVNHRAV